MNKEKTTPNISSQSSSSIDPKSGFCPETKIYHSLRPNVPLPPQSSPLSIADFIFSHLNSSTTGPAAAALIDAATRRCIPCSELRFRVENLSAYLRREIGLSKGDSALVISPNSIEIPVLYLSLFSLGVIVAPSNPASSESELSWQIKLSKPAIAFATSGTAQKLLPYSFRCRTILLDSSEFDSTTKTSQSQTHRVDSAVTVCQSDTAAILYSSGTTGKVKGVKLTHGNFVSVFAPALAARTVRSVPAVSLCAVPYFHVYGFLYCVRTIAMGESVVSMPPRFELRVMLRAIDDLKVTHLALAPPVVVSMVNNVEIVKDYNLGSLEVVYSGGAPLTKVVIQKFSARFPNLPILQAYGMTETAGGVTRTVGPDESKVLGATGRIISNCQAKIVDPEIGIGLPPYKQGELWVRGPSIMKGYVDDEEATVSVLDSEGWLRTGDLCYFDSEGYLFYVDRIKELIKYKGYQVAPFELELLLQSHPDIVDAAVVPYPDEEAGQVPMAFVVRRSGSTVNETQIMDFVAKQVAPYKKIRQVSFMSSIPKNAPGKVLRKYLIKLALSSAVSKL